MISRGVAKARAELAFLLPLLSLELFMPFGIICLAAS
jgi:hypothetical protein